MELYKTMQDFGGVGAVPVLKAIVTAVPVFFPVTLFFLWIFGTASSYYAIFAFTAKKRFWHSLTAMSFVTFILSLVIAAMNEASFTFLSGYWVAFYLLMTVISYFLLSHYK